MAEYISYPHQTKVKVHILTSTEVFIIPTNVYYTSNLPKTEILGGL